MPAPIMPAPSMPIFVYFCCGTGFVKLAGREASLLAPGYYSILFEDPDGVRLELNFVPGKGVFGTEEQALKSDYPAPR